MSFLVVDTETSGFGSDSKILQLGMQLYNNENKIVGSLDTLIDYPDLEIHNQEFHNSVNNGINVSNCHQYGCDLNNALRIFDSWIVFIDEVVGHNLSFDLRMLRQSYERLGMIYPENTINKKSFCTMEKSKDIVKAPLSHKQIMCGYSGYKNPKLEETYIALFGKEMQNSHRAIDDVNATAEVYIELKKRGL